MCGLLLAHPRDRSAVKCLVLNAPFFPFFHFSIFLFPLAAPCCMLHIFGTFFSFPPIYGYALEYSLGENEDCWHQLLSAALDTTCTVLRLYPGCVDTATCWPGGTPQGVPGE